MPKYDNHPAAIELIPNNFKIEIDSRKLFRNMRAAVAAVADGALGTMTEKLLEAVTKVSKAEKTAYHLVFTALNDASVSLLKEYHQDKLDKLKLRGNFEEIRSETGEEIQALEVNISPDIFSNPTGFPFLKTYQPMWNEWLQAEDGLNLTPQEAHKLAKGFPEQFAVSLEKLWDEAPEEYAVIKEKFTENPFKEQAENRQVLDDYYADIEALWTAKIFKEENLNLAKTYIQPDFKISKRNLDKSTGVVPAQETDRNAAFTATDFDENLHNYINNYFLKNKKAFADKTEAEESRLLLLLGQPGQGKTSFCSKVVYDILNDLSFDRDLIFLKLSQTDDSAREFLNHPFKSLERQFEKYQFDYENAVIILDGLDEVFMTNGLTNNEITEFIQTLIRKVRNRPNIHVIVTSRFHYVQLPKISSGDALILSLSPLTLEQQKRWLKVYREEYPTVKLTEKLLVEINDEENQQFKAIRELINQPILLYLVAKADFEIAVSDNRAKIYDALFHAMTRRSWSELYPKHRTEILEK